MPPQPFTRTTILRHKERAPELVDGSHAGGYLKEIEAHLARFFGRAESVWHEVVSDDVHVDILPFPPTAGRDFWTLVTCGMSDRAMKVPAEFADEDLSRAELALSLPRDWIGEGADGWDALRRPDRWWPVGWLKYLARFPHKYDTWLWADHSIPNGDPPLPLGPGTTMCGWILGAPRTWPSTAVTINVPRVTFHAVFPVHWHELEFKVKRGSGALFELLDRAGVTEVMNPRRPRVV